MKKFVHYFRKAGRHFRKASRHFMKHERPTQGSLPKETKRTSYRKFSTLPKIADGRAKPARHTWPSPASGLPWITIIILNRNGAHHLKRLFESIKHYNTYPNFKIVVVDHNSNDSTVDVLREFAAILPISMLPCSRNYDFSYSNNRAAEQADSDFVLFLNNDISFSSDVLPIMMKKLEDPTIGVLGLRLMYPVDIAKDGQPRIQHAGTKFTEDVVCGFYRPINLGANTQTTIQNAHDSVVPAVTAAAMLCRRNQFLSIGGFSEQYSYGYEDVDLCLTYFSQLGLNCYVANDIHLIHNESATQRLSTQNEIVERRTRNIQVLNSRYGWGIRRAVQLDKVQSERYWTQSPFVVGFAVSETPGKDDTAVGDAFTAFELGNACREELGWDVRYLSSKSGNGYELDEIDLLIVLIDNYDLSKIRNAKPGLIKAAWLRNWFERWAARPWFDQFDEYLCSSRIAADYLRKEHGKLRAHVFPIATNPNRFKPSEPSEEYKSDYCFTGSYWKSPRDIETTLAPDQLPYRFLLCGSGWNNHRNFKEYWRGVVPYRKLPEVYNSTKIVLDDANHVTKGWGSVNSRVFDALSSGALVITNDPKGSDEIFGGKLPAYKDKEDLLRLLKNYLEDDEARAKKVEDLRDHVLAQHTYAMRAHTLQKMMTKRIRDKYRFAIKIGVPNEQIKNTWGDYHFALALSRALARQGHAVRIDLLPDWDTECNVADDVTIVLRGRSQHHLTAQSINLMWNISHPEMVSLEEYEQYDHVFVASNSWAEHLSEKIATPVSRLMQCTDPDLFFPDPRHSAPAHQLLFVGNSRRQYRTIVRDSIDMGLPISVYGNDWEEFIAGHHICDQHVDNSILRVFYSKAGVVLNDHWQTMRENGFVSNRIFDAGACGALVISDRISGLSELFGDAVVTYSTADELKSFVQHYLQNEEERRALGNRLQTIILNNHTFDHRAADILQVVDQLADSRKLVRYADPTFSTTSQSMRDSTDGFYPRRLDESGRDAGFTAH